MIKKIRRKMLKTKIQQSYLNTGIIKMVKILFTNANYYVRQSETDRTILWIFKNKETWFSGVKKFIDAFAYEEWFNKNVATIDISWENGKIDIKAKSEYVFQELRVLIRDSGKSKKYDFNLRLI